LCNPGVVSLTLTCFYASAAVNWFENKVNQFTAARTPFEARAAQSRPRYAAIDQMKIIQQSNAIEHVDIIISDIQDHINKKLDFVAFILIALGIEYIGCFNDEKPFTDFGQSKSRFKNGLKFFKNSWYKNKSEWLFENFRGALVHQYRIGPGIVLTSFCKNGADKKLHLTEYEKNKIFVLEQLFDDYIQAVKSFKNEAAKKGNSFNKEKLTLVHQIVLEVGIPSNISISGSTH
jgi:hypothetical protein